ncbi:uncharacterized protein [Epargyreus clarus]|uniref:uncharacterized protein n=1 Tax=Epargyreus clarus TaxID=520877 RepID=UPI003C2F1966
MSSRGARIIYVAGYKFIRHRVTGFKTRWYCADHHKGCKAVIFTIDGDKIIRCNNTHNHFPPSNFIIQKKISELPYFGRGSRGAEVIYYGGFKFMKQRVQGLKTRWWCSEVRKGCKAVIMTYGERDIVTCKNNHNHQPQPQRGQPQSSNNRKTMPQITSLEQATVVTAGGVKRIFVADYYFTRHRGDDVKSRWRCGTHNKHKCSANLFTIDVSGENKVVKINNKHNHAPHGNFLNIDSSRNVNQPIIIRTASGTCRMIVSKYYFTKHRVNKWRTRWHCGTHHKFKCGASVFTVNDTGEVMKLNNSHNHPPTREKFCKT